MAKALADKPAIPFRIPPDIRLVRVNSTTGEPATPGDSRVILEAFKPGTIPVRPSASSERCWRVRSSETVTDVWDWRVILMALPRDTRGPNDRC